MPRPPALSATYLRDANETFVVYMQATLLRRDCHTLLPEECLRSKTLPASHGLISLALNEALVTGSSRLVESKMVAGL